MHNIVKDYYGQQLKHSADLKTSACCDASQVPAWFKHLEFIGDFSRHYGLFGGCGESMPFGSAVTEAATPPACC